MPQPNLRQEPKRKKKNSPIAAVIVLIGFLFSMLEDATGAVLTVVFLLLPFVILVSVFVVVFKAVKKKNTPQTHNHDRIDHNQDIKINPKTGKTEGVPMKNVQHSPQEHWKQQLDGLYASGLIDRSEYQTLLHQKQP